MLFGIKTTVGQEDFVVDLLNKRRISRALGNIYAIFSIPDIKGHVFVEAENEGEAKLLLLRHKYIKGMVKGQIKIEEIEKFISVTSAIPELERGDIVEITSGAFKKEQARVIRVNKPKNKVTVEIIEATVPIPITVDLTDVKLIKKGE
ncbi:MAG: transcription elongation factor Spt5 [archaeon]